MKFNNDNMKQPKNFLCGIKKQHCVKALGLIAIISFVIYMKFTLYEPLGRNDFQIISLESDHNVEVRNEETENKGGISNFQQAESYDTQDKKSIETNYDDNDSNSSDKEYVELSFLNAKEDNTNNEASSEINPDETDPNMFRELTDTNNNDNVQIEIYNNENSEQNDPLESNLELKESSTVSKTESIENSDNSNKSLKYILQWTSGKKSPFYHMGNGQDHFFKFNCTYTNCFVTDNKTLLSNLTEYDAIVFNGNYVIQMDESQLPQDRSINQKYIFGGTEPAAMKLACKPVLDNFFNWTWTYRLDSDILWRYITIFDLNGKEVGPKENMIWPKEMEPIDSETKIILDGKTKAAAWFVSRCKSPSHREDVVNKITTELAKFGLSVDVYGKCGNFTCPRSVSEECFELVKTDYYFYFSFENSFSIDYVTEKLLTPLLNYAIPVVYGSADYSRFLPLGSYLDARVLSPEELAETMHDLINDKERYYDFFRWRNHFKYKRTEDSNDICNVCSALNNQHMVNTRSTHENFREWWNDVWHSSCKH